MKVEIITEYSLWLIPLCLLLGVVYSMILYFRDSKNDFTITVNRVLALIRAVLVSIIAFLLLNPQLKTLSYFTEKPILIFAQDNSGSIPIGKDSIYYMTNYTDVIENLLDNIKGDNELKKYRFGETVSDEFFIDFSDRKTDISNMLEYLSDRYSHRNVGALIIASDGNYNSGLNPLYSSANIDFPIFTIALGDTIMQKDVIISKVNYNRIAYHGNEFPIEVIVNGNKCKGLATEISVLKDDSVLFAKTIDFESDNQFETVMFKLVARETGMQRYRIRATPLESEISLLNNVQDIYIDVIEGRQKILILSNSPHPDITAIKQSLLSNRNYEVEDFLIDGFSATVAGYNLIILHGLPSVKNNITSVLDEIKEHNISVLYILSRQTGLALFNSQNAGLSLTGSKIIYNEAQAILNPDFSLFTLSDQTIRLLPQFPPLIAPYGKFKVQTSASSLFFQRIESVDTREPLVLFNKTLDTKHGVITGSGLWKWRLTAYLKDGSHNSFDEIINKIVQYLSIRVDKSFFRVYLKNNFVENENLTIDAEVYNESYELVNDADVSISLINSDGEQFPFEFSRTSAAYYLNAGALPADHYRYSAQARKGNSLLTDQGEFTITSLNLEDIDPSADHSLLYRLANQKGGDMYYPDELDELVNTLDLREEITSVSYTQRRYTELLNFYWLLLLIIGLISIEWFIRKRAGGY